MGTKTVGRLNGTDVDKRPLIAYRELSITPDNVPLPGEGTQDDHQYKELVRKLNVVPWYASANEFAILLALLLENSVTHRACVNSIAQWAVGDGLLMFQGRQNALLSAKRPKGDVPDDVTEQVDLWLSEINPRQHMGELMREAFVSYGGSGNVWMELARGQVGGKNGQKVLHAYVHDFTQCLNTRTDENGERSVIISPDFRDEYLRKYPPATIPHWPKWGKKDDKGMERTVIYWGNKAPRRTHYGVPDSIASVVEQGNEHEASMFNKENFDNGFFPSAIIDFFAPNGMTKKQAGEFLDKVNETFTGKGRRRKIMARVLEQGALESKVTQLAESVDGSFKELDARLEKKIIRSHGWYEILTGNPTPGKLGNVQELRNTAMLALNTKVVPLQNDFLIKVMGPMMREWSAWMGNKIASQYYIGFSNNLPTTFFGNIDLNAIITGGEAREVVGYPAFGDERDMKTLAELGAKKTAQTATGGATDGNAD